MNINTDIDPPPVKISIGKMLMAMDLSDSMIIERHTSSTISRYISYVKKRKNCRFKTKTVNKGVRVTRIEWFSIGCLT